MLFAKTELYLFYGITTIILINAEDCKCQNGSKKTGK